jgi:hypothetical protein
MAFLDVPERKRSGTMVSRANRECAQQRKTMIIALARKLLISLWRLVTTGEVPAGVALRPLL